MEAETRFHQDEEQQCEYQGPDLSPIRTGRHPRIVLPKVSIYIQKRARKVQSEKDIPNDVDEQTDGVEDEDRGFAFLGSCEE